MNIFSMVVVVVVADSAWPSAYKIWEVERVGAKIARLMPDQSARTSRVRRARRLPPHVSVIGTGQVLGISTGQKLHENAQYPFRQVWIMLDPRL